MGVSGTSPPQTEHENLRFHPGVKELKDEQTRVLDNLRTMNIEVKATQAKKLTNIMVKVFGGIEMDQDEKSFLSLGPDFAMLDVVDSAKAAREFLIAITKI